MNNKFKYLDKKYKIMIGLGTATAVVLPIAIAVPLALSKGSDKGNTNNTGGYVYTPQQGGSGQQSQQVIRSIADGQYKGQVLPAGFTIPDTVTSIGDSAFEGATLPDGFTIPSSVTSIGEHAFEGATLPDGFKFKGNYSWNSSITIKAYAFRGVVLPQSFNLSGSWKVTIEHNAFERTTNNWMISLNDNFDRGNLIIGDYAFKDAIFNQDYSKIPGTPTQTQTSSGSSSSSSTSSKYDQYWTYDSQLNEWELSSLNSPFSGVEVPADFTWKPGKVAIKQDIFRGAIIPASFHLPNGVYIDYSANFYGTQLPEGFKIPDDAQGGSSIGNFYKATLPDGCVWSKTDPQAHADSGGFLVHKPIAGAQVIRTSGGSSSSPTSGSQTASRIAPNAFEGTKGGPWLEWDQVDSHGNPIAGATLRKIESIKNGEFANMVLPMGFTIADSVQNIRATAFLGSTLPAGFTIPSSVKLIWSNAFYKAKLPVGYMWSKLDGYGNPMAGSSVVPVHIDPTATSIEQYAFRGATLPAGFTIPGSVTSIGKEAFYEVALPAGYMWSKLDSHGDPTVDSSVVPVHIDPTATSIEQYAFRGVTLPAGFTIPSSVTSIGKDAFRGATLPAGFTIPSSVTSIENMAFYGVTLPAGFTIPQGVTNSTFDSVTLPAGYMWSKLDSHGDPTVGSSVVPVHIDPTATSIEQYAFRGVTLPAGFTIPSSVTSIGGSAFQGATLPAGFTIPSSVTSIGGSAFQGATLPAGFTIPQGVTRIEKDVFDGATLPAGFTIPHGVTWIDSQAFGNTILPAGFTIPDMAYIRDGAFSGATLPNGYKWSKTDNHGDPMAGSSVIVKIY